MAYYRKRSTVYRRKPRGRRSNTPWYNKQYKVSPYSAALKALAGVRYLKTLVNSEVMKKDNDALINTTINNVGSVTLLTGLAIGDNANDRTGDSVLLSYISSMMRIVYNPTSDSTIYRYWVIEDLQQQSDAAPTFGDIFNARDTMSKLNPKTMGRYKIHLEGMYTQDPNGPTVLQKKFYLDFKGKSHHLKFNGVLASDIQKGHLYFVSVSNQITSLAPTILLDARVCYHDN